MKRHKTPKSLLVCFTLTGISLLFALTAWGSETTRPLSRIDSGHIRGMFDRIDPDHPGLEKVRDALAAGDTETAEAAYLDHYRSRPQPVLNWGASSAIESGFAENSAEWDFMTSHPAHIAWRDRETVKPLISREPGYTSSRAEGQIPSSYTLLEHADMMLENLVFIPYHPEDGVQVLGSDWDWEHVPPPGGAGKRWTLSLCYQYCLRALAQAWWLTGDERYIAKLVAIATDYIVYLPTKSDWIWLPDMQIARNYQQLMPFILSWNKLAPRDFCTIQYFLSGPCAESMEAVENAPGNQMLYNGLGLLWLGVGMPEFRDAAHWRERGVHQIARYFGDGASYPDGSSKENSFGYIAGASTSGFEALKLLSKNGYGTPPGFEDAMVRRAEFLVYTSKPDGAYVWTGDATRGTALPYVGKIAETTGREDLMYVASLGERGTAPPKTSCWFPWMGVGVMRSAWTHDANFLYFDVGPVGTVHKHEGKLAVEVAVFGRSMVEDLGIHTYGRDERDIPWTMFFTGSSGHNTVIVDGNSQVRITTGLETNDAPQDNTWHSSKVCDYLAGSYEQGYDDPPFKKTAENIDLSVQHHRQVMFIKADKSSPTEYWIVSDYLTGSGRHVFEQLFHLVQVKAVIDSMSKTLRTVTADAPDIAFIPADPARVTLDVAEGRMKPGIQGWYVGEGAGGRPVPAPCVIYRRTSDPGDEPLVFHTVLVPLRTDDEALPTVSCPSDSEQGWIRIEHPGGGFDICCMPLKPGQYEHDGLVFDGAAGLWRFDADGALISEDIIRGGH